MIELDNVSIRVGDYVLQGLSFRIDRGVYAVLMGQTGLGKTTILEAICGLRRIQSGRILIDGHDVSSCTPADRNVGYVPQDLALFPTMTVQEHLEFALRIRKRPTDEIRSKAVEFAKLLNIDHLLNRRTRGLSGGESQRVALGRALAFGPSIVLLDEPLSALDANMRRELQDLLRTLKESQQLTVLHVTHNQEEADALADCRLGLARDPETGSAQAVWH